MAIRIAPTLAEMATYPFVRLEEARRALVAARRRGDRLRQGRSERADRPDDPAGAHRRAAGALAVSARGGAAGAPRGRCRLVRAPLRRRRSIRTPSSSRPTARRRRSSRSPRCSSTRVRRRTSSRTASLRTPCTSAARSSRARSVQTLPLVRERGFLPDLRSLGDDTAIVWVNYPHNPTGAVAPLAFYEELAELAARHDFVIASDEAYTELWFDEPPVVGAPGRGSLARHRLPDAEQALVDDRLPLGLRRGAAGGDRGTQGVPPDRRDCAAGVRPARIRRRLERRAARRGDPRPLPREARRLAPRPRAEGLGGRRERCDDVSLGRDARRGCVRRQLLERGVLISPGSFFGPSGAGYVRFALVPTLEECERAARILEEL